VLREFYQNSAVQESFWLKIKSMNNPTMNFVLTSTQPDSPIIFVFEYNSSRLFEEEHLAKMKEVNNSVSQKLLFLVNTEFLTGPSNNTIDMSCCGKGDMQCEYLTYYKTNWNQEFEKKFNSFVEDLMSHTK